MTRTSIQQLTENFHGTGTIEWIGLRPARRADMLSVQSASLKPGLGLEGDRFRGSLKSKRQVSFIQAEHINAMSHMLGKESIAPELFRRNIVISGINLLALKGMQFKLGSALLQMSCLCHPCSRMEETFGPGGYNLVRGHGGILAKVILPGEIAIGSQLDQIEPIPLDSASDNNS